MGGLLAKFGKLFFVAALVVQPSIAAERASSIFPPEAIELNDNYGDWYGSTLEKLGEKPLWPDDAANTKTEIIRFTFIPGATRLVGRDATAIRIEIGDKEARLFANAEYGRGRGRSAVTRKVADKRLSSVQIAKLRELAEKADPWSFPVGTWEEDDGSISIHCTELLMERRQPAGYSVSHVLISCNQPNRLMPLVNYVAELAEQKQKDLRYSYSVE